MRKGDPHWHGEFNNICNDTGLTGYDVNDILKRAVAEYNTQIDISERNGGKNSMSYYHLGICEGLKLALVLAGASEAVVSSVFSQFPKEGIV